jgi:hypothetical protein
MLSTPSEDTISIVVGTEQFELKELFGQKDRFLNVKRYFDGRHSVKEISRITNVSEQSITEVVEQFGELGILRSEEEVKSIPVGAFLEKVKESCLMWQRQIGYHRLFSLLKNKEVRKEVFLGLILETYHYVNSAPKHISTAIANCRDPRWRDILNDYFIDEYDHGQLYVRTLQKMGLQEDRIINSHPIIGTMSLVNMLCEIGRASTLGYLACTSLFEANKEDFLPAKQEMEAIAVSYGFSASDLSEAIGHMEQDIKMEHKSLLGEALEGQENINADEAHYAVNCLHDLKHSFDQSHDQILQYYSDISNYIPRLKVDYFSL